MADLTAFRLAVRDARRTVGYTQQQLARAVGLHPDVLSHKLNGHDGSVLTMRDGLAVVETLVRWGAFTTRPEVDAVLGMISVPSQLAGAQPWYAELTGPAPEGAPAPPPAWRLADIPRPLSPVPPPQPVTPFIGRSAEVAAVAAAVRSSRLVTITGVGGSGKTRVALEAATAVADSFRDGVAFADLAPVSDPSLIGVLLLQALGWQPLPNENAESQLKDALRSVHVLIVVDNLEHLVDGSDLLGRVLPAAPQVHLLTTSRVRLRLYGEQEFRLPPLGLPADRAATEAGIRESEAVQLFLQRARAVQTGFDPQGPALDAVAGICSDLDGLPLAIELAAAKVRMWSPEAIRRRLGDRLRFLAESVRDVPGRHQSLRATLDWSDALLSSDQRDAFLRLGVFAGSFDVAGAAAVVDRDPDAAFGLLSELNEQSLLERSVAGPTPETRFRMLESVRHYALSRWTDPAALDGVRRSHLRHYSDLTADILTRDRGVIRPDHAERLQAEHADISAALEWAASGPAEDPGVLTDALRLGTVAIRIWNLRVSVPEGQLYLDRLLDAAARVPAVPTEVRVAALNRMANLAVNNGEVERASALASRSLELSRELGDLAGMGMAHRQLGEAALANDDLTGARPHFTTQLTLGRRAQNRAVEADAYNMLGQLSARLGNYRESEEELWRSLAIWRELGSVEEAGDVLDSLADLAFRRWDITMAATHWAEALELHRQTDNRRAIAYHLEGCARVSAINDRPAEALRFVTAAQRLRAVGGWVLPEPDRAFLEQVLSPPVTQMASRQREEAVAAGRWREIGDLIEEASTELEAIAKAPSSGSESP